MPVDDALASLAAEYGAMTSRQRRAVLRLLDADARATLERLAAELAEETLSPWLAERCDEARRAVGPLTDAVRRMLVEPTGPDRASAPTRGPSLAGRIGAMLGGQS